jgi:SURF4 family
MTHFLKNISITGGLLQIVALGAGTFSIDGAALQSHPRLTGRRIVSLMKFSRQLPFDPAVGAGQRIAFALPG